MQSPLISRLPDWAWECSPTWLAVAKLVNELGLGIAVVLTIIGIAMHWHLPNHRMSMEERAKDGKMTEDEAGRRVKLFGRCALVTTLTGMTVLAVVLLEFSK
ncbi:MAG: hypothetical protein HZA93_12480 [Verrucomicrobia bacterium]|nr:hypothetical protein [Verrucomicrobiota bacterium]